MASCTHVLTLCSQLASLPHPPAAAFLGQLEQVCIACTLAPPARWTPALDTAGVLDTPGAHSQAPNTTNLTHTGAPSAL